MKRKIA